jgi:S1-C subfamily serine protease
LTEIIDESLHTDIKKMVEQFDFPDIGLETKRLTPAFARNMELSVTEGVFVEDVEGGGVASEAGFQERDVIIAVDGQPVASNLEYETALLDSIEQKEARITVDRFGAQECLVLEFNKRVVDD